MRALAHQADFDNERRWLTWDLLCGRVASGHPLWRRLCDHGFERRLQAIASSPCPPQVVGVNHYLTSDRFLDHRCERYPPDRCGGNAFMRYADVEAIRVLVPAPGGLEGALEEAAGRYGLPVAVTEAHNGCTREEQVRWFQEAWETAHRLRERGFHIEAVTSWALLGAYDWNSLLTREEGHYEPGAFDIRGGTPRPTALAGALRDCAAGSRPGLASSGWWRRDIRLQYEPVFRSVDTPEPRLSWRAPRREQPPLMIVGASGTLGRALARSCEWRGLDYVLTCRRELDLGDPDSIREALDRHAPWGVINAAGFVRVDEAEEREDDCFKANTHGALALAEACRRRDLAFAGLSSDLVFDGEAGRAYLEDDAPRPLGVYGRSKAEAERGVLKLKGKGLMVRTAAFFSPYDPHNFAAHVVRTLASDQALEAAEDLVVSPTYVPDLVDALLDLVIDGETGLWHLVNQGETSWAGFARSIAQALGLDPGKVEDATHTGLGWRAKRPRHAPLDSRRGRLLPPLGHALERYAATLRRSGFLVESDGEAVSHQALATGA
jgi:dTDP-4-dehydrorhamnose reductase